MLTTVLVACAATGAQAQLGGTVDPNTTAEELQLDTDVTPQAKESDRWDLVHGAMFPQTETIPESATRFDTDLFALSFENPKLGLAGGSACPSEPEKMPGEDDSEFGRRVSECADPDGTKHRRGPTLYRYREPEDADATWDPVALPGATKPGYVGAIAWIDDARGDDTKALVVGGTGAYPRRDLGAAEQDSFGRSNAIADPTDPAKADEAGDPRAWIYDSTTNSATELDLSALAADKPARAGMRGLTAVDCYEDPYPGSVGHPTFGTPDPDEPQTELCFAGALGQVWEFLGDEFTGERIDAQSSASELTRANVLRYRVRDIGFNPSQEEPQATAVTAGCCAADELNHKASVLAYNSGSSPPWSATERSYSATAPESLYSIGIASPGGPEESGEPPSTFGPSSTSSAASFSTTRLVSGDDGGSSGWAVGELRSSRLDGLGARGLSVSAQPKPKPESSANVTLNGREPGNNNFSAGIFEIALGAVQGRSYEGLRPTPEEIAQGWEPIDQQRLDESISSRHYYLPSYSANAVEMIGSGDQADGWAVGDHGAILRLSASGRLAAAGATEPKPPNLGGARKERFPDADAYETTRPALPSHAGVVPPLGPETVELREPRMNPAGAVTADGTTVEEIVMSRDGTEGWAYGGDGRSPLHYDGVSWSACDTQGTEGLSASDPTCKALASVNVVDAERVPLENDPDPTNDDEFEVLGITGDASFVRYRDGRWLLEPPQERQELVRSPRDLAVVAPGDSWVLGGNGGGGTDRERLFHLDGDRWYDCRADPESCDDPTGRLPVPNYFAQQQDADLPGLAVAGRRVYVYGSRTVGEVGTGTSTSTRRRIPLILYRDQGGTWTDGSRPGEDGGGFDPAFSNPGTSEAGRVSSLTVVQAPDGKYQGWAVGAFGAVAEVPSAAGGASPRLSPDTALMRLAPGSQGWRRFRSPGAFEDYMIAPLTGPQTPADSGREMTNSRLQVGYPSELAPNGAFIGQLSDRFNMRGGRLYGFNAARERFELLPTGRPQGVRVLQQFGEARPAGTLSAMAPDGRGGFWAAVSGYFFHYSDRAREEPFEEVANPLGIRNLVLGDIAAGPDGSVWAASETNEVFRYDRVLGWQAGRVPGWDPGRVVTRSSRAEALAVGPGGEGLLVGEGGRIAQLSPEGLSLDPAAGRSCALGDPIPCGTSRDLSAVAIADDGSALATGERLTVLWRAPGEGFRTVSGPSLPSTTRIVAVSYPTATRAFLLTSESTVYRGTLSGTDWRWELDAKASEGTELPVLDANERAIPLNDLAIEPSGHGYAVGDDGLVLERSAEGLWRRVEVPAHEDLTSVGFAQPAGEGVLIGGESGVILTGQGADFELARVGDFRVGDTDHTTGAVIGFAQLPGASEGSVDAWAAIAPAPGGSGDGRLLRYRSEAGIDSAANLSAVADAPPKAEGELSLATFGKSDCGKPEAELCPEMSATTTTNEVVTQRIVDELAARDETEGLDLSVLSGDAVDSAGMDASSLADIDRLGDPGLAILPMTRRAGQLKHRRYAELVTDPLEEHGGFFGAIGSQDLSETFACLPAESDCETTKQFANAGENYAWREAFAGHADPWGDGEASLEAPADSEIVFEPAPGSEDNSLRVEDQSADADGEGVAPEAKAEIGGANTHYAVDAVRDGESIARIVFVDTSLRSLAANDPLQQPHELAGGQQRFLERMICRPGDTTTTAIDECTREPGQKAIVVSNTPTYSYGPGALSHTALDGTTFEATMLRYDVDLVISGALGYTGLYYTLAPGVHEPCAGGAYPESPPSGRTPDCLAGPTGPAEAATQSAPADTPDPASLIEEQGLSGAYPTLIAAGAGGKFGPDGTDPPSGPAGQWHGYSIARLLPDGDLVVEQRPILDWIGMDAPDRTLPPRARMKLSGYGRSPISTTTESRRNIAFHYAISTAAITHRYDLLLADPDEPWVPCRADDVGCGELHANLAGAGGGATGDAGADPAPPSNSPNPCAPYLCLPQRIGTIDDQSGQIRAGDGKYPETFAIAMLSVDEEVATYPLVFKRSPAFVTSPSVRTGALPKLSGARPGAPPPPPPPPGLPQIPQVEIPQIPPPPGIPQLTAATPPELQPPAPPAPPPPSQQPAPLDLSVAPPGVSISTPTALIQPPTPPVNPAPPGGARREARQRQAAAQKGGADSDASEGADSTRSAGGDFAQGERGAEGAEMTRLDHGFSRLERGSARGLPARLDASFTIAPRESASSVPRNALYGGGITLAALSLALAFSTLRPGPRRRRGPEAAPAWARTRRR